MFYLLPKNVEKKGVLNWWEGGLVKECVVTSCKEGIFSGYMNL